MHHLIENWGLQGHHCAAFHFMQIHFPDWHLTALPNPSGKQGKLKAVPGAFNTAGLTKLLLGFTQPGCDTGQRKQAGSSLVLPDHSKSAGKRIHRQRCAGKCALEGYWLKKTQIVIWRWLYIKYLLLVSIIYAILEVVLAILLSWDAKIHSNLGSSGQGNGLLTSGKLKCQEQSYTHLFTRLLLFCFTDPRFVFLSNCSINIFTIKEMYQITSTCFWDLDLNCKILKCGQSPSLPKPFTISYNGAKLCKQCDRHLHFLKLNLTVSPRGRWGHHLPVLLSVAVPFPGLLKSVKSLSWACSFPMQNYQVPYAQIPIPKPGWRHNPENPEANNASACPVPCGIHRLSHPVLVPAPAANKTLVLPIARGLGWPPPPSHKAQVEERKEFLHGIHLKCIWIKGKNSIWVTHSAGSRYSCALWSQFLITGIGWEMINILL